MYLIETFYGLELAHADLDPLGGLELLEPVAKKHDVTFVPFLVRNDGCCAFCLEYNISTFDYPYYNYTGTDLLPYFKAKFTKLERFIIAIKLEDYYSEFMEKVDPYLLMPYKYIYATQEYTLRQYMLLEENHKYMNCNHI